MTTSNVELLRPIFLLATDFSDASLFAVRSARERALRAAPCHLHVVHVLDAVIGGTALDELAVTNSSTILGQALADARVRIDEVCRELACGEAVTVSGHLKVGNAVTETIALAHAVGADEIVVGSHGRRGISRLVLGSVAESLVRQAPCSVTVARPRDVSAVVAIEPPCAECVAARVASKGATQWCARHLEHHPHGHTYSDRREGSASEWQSVLGK